MKKEYISPDIKVSVIEAVTILAASGDIQVNTKDVKEIVDDGGELGAKKGYNLWGEDE